MVWPLLPRIAFISSLGFGGSTTFLCNLAGELVRRGVPVLVVSPESENVFASDFQARGVQIIVQQRWLIYEDRMHSMLQTLAKFQPTVVVGCVGSDSYEVLRYVPAGIQRLAIIQTDHPSLYDTALPYAGCLDAIVGISTKITERLADMAVFHNVAKLCLLHGVTMPDTFKPRGHGLDPLRILYLGRIMDPQKRAYLFPQILDGLRKSGIPFRWMIVGQGDKRAELERAMPSTLDQQVSFTGAVPNALVAAILDQHDIFLLASDAEGLPISLLEAMAHGVVPVVSDLESGIRDVVDTTNGMLVPVNEIEGYARAIIHLHEHRDELAAKSAAAHARVRQEFSVAAMTDRWLAAFPAAPVSPPVWPQRWKISAPLTAAYPVYFSPPLRAARRLMIKLRKHRTDA